MSRATSLQDCYPLKERNLQSITSLIRVLWFSSLQTCTRCTTLPLVVRFIFVWIPREKPRVNLFESRPGKRQRGRATRTEEEGEKVVGESWGRNKRMKEKEKGRISRVKRRNKRRWTKGVEGIEFTARKVGHFTFARTSSLCFVPTVMFTCRGRCCIRILAQTHTHVYIVQTDTRAKDVERLLEDSPFSRKNVNFSVSRWGGEGGRGKSETGRKRIDRNG